MPRNTNNSGGELASVAALALAVKDKTTSRHSHDASGRGKHSRRTLKAHKRSLSRGTPSTSSSCSSDDVDADIEPDQDDSDDADEEEGDDEAEPAAFAPSVRPSIETGDQAGQSSDDEPAEDCTVASLEKRKKKKMVKIDNGLHTPKSTASSRRTSQDGNSDDDYAGVDMISDSDEEDPTVEQLETKNIIDSEEATKPASTMLSHSLDHPAWDDGDLYGSAFMSDAPYFDAEYACTEGDIFGGSYDPYSHTADSSAFEGFSPQPMSSRSSRRVRFQTPVLHHTTSADADNLGLPSSVQTTLGHVGFDSTDHDLDLDNIDDKSSCGSSSGYESGFHFYRDILSC